MVARAAGEPFDGLLERLGVEDRDDGAEVPRISFATALAQGSDPLGILPYLTGIGIVVRSLEDLMRINEIADEEELSAYHVAEGVAITVASQGDWVLFLSEPS